MFYWVIGFLFVTLAVAFLIETVYIKEKRGRLRCWFFFLLCCFLSYSMMTPVAPVLPEPDWIWAFIVVVTELIAMMIVVGSLAAGLDVESVAEVPDRLWLLIRLLVIKRFAKPPVLVQCTNNGVTAVARWADYGQPDQKLSEVLGMLVIPGKTMLFGNPNSRYLHPRAKEHFTGTLADLKVLTGACEVKHGYGHFEHAFFVPYSSWFVDEIWEERHFPRITLREAYRMIHGNRAAELIDPTQ